MNELFPPLDRDKILPTGITPPTPVGDQIVVGNLDHTVAAIGHGASVIYQQALTAADQARAREDFEHQKLAEAVGHLIKTLYDRTRKTLPVGNNPYKYLLPFEFSDAWRFFGRDDIRAAVVSMVRGDDLCARLLVLHGDAGMGKTSFLRASVAPALVAEGHLPLLVRITHEPVATSVKHALLPDLQQCDFLREAPLCEYLLQVQALLPEGKRVYLLMDQFEEFLALPRLERERFTGELADCLFAEPAVGHWLLGIQSARVGYLSNLAPTIPQPLANTLVLPPLTPAQARDAILKPAALAGLQVEEPLVDAILQDLGGDAFDPSRLQLVCYMLAQGDRSGQRALTLSDYVQAGKAEAILRDHLTLVLKQNLPAEDAEPAWQALAVISRNPGGVKQQAVLSELANYAIAREQGQRALEMLEINRLIRLHDGVYRLTSASLLKPIRAWEDQRAALEQVQVEAHRQVQRVRESALRGLFGGGIGFMIAFLLTYFDQTLDWLVLPLVTLFEGLLGGLAGIFFIFALDIARVSFRGRMRFLQIAWGGLAGAAVFASAFLFHKLLHYPSDQQILMAAGEGALWGLVAGMGTAVALISRRRLWQTLALFAVLSGLALWVGELFGNAYHRPRFGVGGRYIELMVPVAGALMYLALAGASAWAKRGDTGIPQSEKQPAG